jgi:hypothetical protein
MEPVQLEEREVEAAVRDSDATCFSNLLAIHPKSGMIHDTSIGSVTSPGPTPTSSNVSVLLERDAYMYISKHAHKCAESVVIGPT